MEVTISIMNYNYGKYLSQAIESALNQTIENIVYEVLLIDDGSTDDSDEVANNYIHFKNFRISKSNNQGFAASLTRAITEAKGKYVFLLDADDYYELNKIAEVLPLLRQGKLYVSDTSQYVDESGKKIKGGGSGSTSTVAINKEAVMPLMPLENEISLYALYKLGKGQVSHCICTNYRFHNNSFTNREIPGKWQTYLSKVTNNLSIRLCEIGKGYLPQIWNSSEKEVLKAMFFFKSRAYYNKLEACLETHQLAKSFK